MADGVEKAHAPQGQQDRFQGGEKGVDLPQDLGGVPDSRRELVGRRAGRLGLVELHAADPQKGQDRQGEDDDPHAPQPLNEAPPEQQPLGNPFDVREDRRTGGGEAGNRFEKGVRERGELAAHVKRQGPEEPHGDPPEGHDGHPFPLADDLCRLAPEQQVQGHAADGGDADGLEQGNDAAVPVPEPHQQGRGHGQGQKQDQDAHHA